MIDMTNRHRPSMAQTRCQSGFALIGAIAMLGLFALLGTAYVRYMMIEVDDTARHLDVVRADHLASGGIYAAIGEMEGALAKGESPADLYTISQSVYRYEGGERVGSAQDVQVFITDESARVNINHAPSELLADLGMDAESIANLERALPTRTGLRSDSRSWFNAVDELLTRAIVDRRSFESIDTDRLTVYSVGDPAKPAGFINLNSADPAVLAAVFGIEDATEVEALASSRPFDSWQDVLTKTGREPSSFNVAPPRYASRDMPDALSLSSRCFRLRSEVGMNYRGARGRVITAVVEAVVLFGDDGTYSIRYWNEHPNAPAGVESLGAAVSETDVDETAL